MKIIALIKGASAEWLGISILEHQVENHFEEIMSWKKKISWSAMGFIRILWIFGRRCSRNAFQRKNSFFSK